MLLFLKWFGSASGMLGAVLIALNMPSSGYGFILFLFSAICWAIVGWHLREMSLFWLNVTFIAINILGIYRWLII